MDREALRNKIDRYRGTAEPEGVTNDEVVRYAAALFHEYAHMVIESNGGLHERRQGVTAECGEGVAAAHWTLASLANPFMPGSDEVIDLILLRREMNRAQMAQAKGEMH